MHHILAARPSASARDVTCRIDTPGASVQEAACTGTEGLTLLMQGLHASHAAPGCAMPKFGDVCMQSIKAGRWSAQVAKELLSCTSQPAVRERIKVRAVVSWLNDVSLGRACIVVCVDHAAPPR